MASLIRVLASALALALFAAGAATAQPASCDRRCLEDFVDRYLDALVRHDPRAVPIAAAARNGQRLEVGDGLWRSVKAKGKLFKVEKGEIRRIEATLERVPYGVTSGWSGWEDGMSDRARDVTRQ